jgi:hypothetical protein
MLDAVESALVEVASKTGPILAPVPTAYLIGRATIAHLDWPPVIGGVAAVVVECLGLASTGLALDLYGYNRGKRKADPPAPFKLSAALIGVYFAVALGLTVALDIVPGLAIYASGVFPFLSLVGVSILAIRIDHRARLITIEEQKADDKKKRARRKAEKQQAVSDRSVTAIDRRWPDKAAFLSDVDRPVGLTSGELSAMAGISPRTARRWLEAGPTAQAIKSRAHSDNGKE